MRAWMRICVFISVIALGACSSRTAELFVTQAEWDVWGGGHALEGSLSAAAKEKGYALSFVVIPVLDQAEGRLTRELSRSNPPLVIASPLLSRDVYDVVSRSKARSAVFMDGPEAAVENGFVRLVSDRREAFRTMGWATGLSLKESGGKAGILVPSSRGSGAAEIDAFISGLTESGLSEAPVVRELPEPLDKAVVQKVVSELRGQGVEAFLPRLGEMNTACLEALAASGGFADTEDWRVSHAYPAQVFLSVEEDIAAGIARALEAAGSGGSTVAGPAVVVCGGARPVPEEAKGRVQCP